MNIKKLCCSRCLGKITNKIENVHNRKEYILGHWCEKCKTYEGVRFK